MKKSTFIIYRLHAGLTIKGLTAREDKFVARKTKSGYVIDHPFSEDSEPLGFLWKGRRIRDDEFMRIKSLDSGPDVITMRVYCSEKDLPVARTLIAGELRNAVKYRFHIAQKMFYILNP